MPSPGRAGRRSSVSSLNPRIVTIRGRGVDLVAHRVGVAQQRQEPGDLDVAEAARLEGVAEPDLPEHRRTMRSFGRILSINRPSNGCVAIRMTTASTRPGAERPAELDQPVIRRDGRPPPGARSSPRTTSPRRSGGEVEASRTSTTKASANASRRAMSAARRAAGSGRTRADRRARNGTREPRRQRPSSWRRSTPRARTRPVARHRVPAHERWHTCDATRGTSRSGSRRRSPHGPFRPSVAVLVHWASRSVGHPTDATSRRRSAAAGAGRRPFRRPGSTRQDVRDPLRTPRGRPGGRRR